MWPVSRVSGRAATDASGSGNFWRPLVCPRKTVEASRGRIVLGLSSRSRFRGHQPLAFKLLPQCFELGFDVCQGIFLEIDLHEFQRIQL